MLAPQSPVVKEGLRRLRRRRTIYFSLLLAFLPSCALLAVLGVRHPLIPAVGIVLLFAIAAWAYTRLHRSRCPRCGELFFVQTLTKDSWTPFSSTSIPPQRKCQKCGLDLYA